MERQQNFSRWFLAVLMFFSTPAMGFVGGENEPPETVLNSKDIIETQILEVPEVEPRTYGKLSNLIEIENGVFLYIIEEGQGMPLVLLNGGPGNSLLSFLPHFDKALGFSRVIYYDPRGVGQSTWKTGPEGYTTQQAINDLELLREKLGYEKWVVLGWSWGGLLAQLYAIEHTDRVLGLVLVSSSNSMGLDNGDVDYREYRTDEEFSRIRSIYTKSGSKVVAVHSDQLTLEEVQKMVFNTHVNGDWKRQFYYKPSLERLAHLARYEWWHAKNFNPQMRATSFNQDLRGAFKENPLPVLGIFGRHDLSFPIGYSEMWKEEIPTGRFLEFEHSSHNSFASEPDLFFEELENFLAGLKQ